MKKYIKKNTTKIVKYKCTEIKKYKIYKKYKNSKNTWVPAISRKTQKRAKHKKSKNLKNNSRKDTCASYFLQNLNMIYRDSTKNQIKIGGVCYFALRTSYHIFGLYGICSTVKRG